MNKPIMLVISVAVVLVTLCSPAGAETAHPCDANAEKINKVKTVKRDAVLRLLPSNKAKKVINPKATETMHSIQYAQIDSSTKVREVCRQNGWSYVELTEPEWLVTSHKGWVQSNVLNAIKISGSGKRVYRENEVGWDKYTTPYKKQVLFAINNFLQDDCKEGLDTFSVTQSPSRTTKKDPVFFIACGSGSKARNIFFKKSDIEKIMRQSGK